MLIARLMTWKIAAPEKSARYGRQRPDHPNMA